MGRVTGWRCDAPKCNAVTETEKLPPGWIKVTPVIPEDRAVRDDNCLIVCTNRCLKDLGKARYDAAVEVGDEPPPPYSRKKREPE